MPNIFNSHYGCGCSGEILVFFRAAQSEGRHRDFLIHKELCPPNHIFPVTNWDDEKRPGHFLLTSDIPDELTLPLATVAMRLYHMLTSWLLFPSISTPSCSDMSLSKSLIQREFSNGHLIHCSQTLRTQLGTITLTIATITCSLPLIQASEFTLVISGEN